MRRYSSGQRGQTVNLLATAFESSNLSRRTIKKSRKPKVCGTTLINIRKCNL